MEFESDYKKLTILAGMAAAMGALFPTPMLAILMIYELGDPPKYVLPPYSHLSLCDGVSYCYRTYMESILILSFGACVSFMIYYWLVEYTYLDHLGSTLLVSLSFVLLCY